jgi:hypothetical protein
MGLSEQVDQLRERIHALKSLKERANRAEDFEGRAQTLSEISLGLETLRASSQVLTEAGIEVSQIDQGILATLKLKAQQLRDSYAIDRASILSPFPDHGFQQVFVVPCNTLRKSADQTLKASWSNWLRARMLVIDQEVLNVLAGVDALSTNVVNIQKLLVSINEHAATLPSSTDKVREAEASCTEVNQAWQELTGDGVAPEVLQFLRAAGSDTGASYDLFQPSILDWIDTHNLRHVLRIRLG